MHKGISMTQYKSRGQRKGDNGDTYTRSIEEDLQKKIDDLEEQLEKKIKGKHTKIGGVFGLSGGGIITYLIMYFLGFNPATGERVGSPDNAQITQIEQKVSDTRSKMYANKADITQLKNDFNSHIDLQTQWQENLLDRIERDNDYIKEKLRDIAERVK